MRYAMRKLDLDAILAVPAVTIDNEALSDSAKTLIWASAVDAGYTDPKKVIEDYELTTVASLSTTTIVSWKKFVADFEDMKATLDDFDYETPEQYLTAFSYITLPDGRYLLTGWNNSRTS